MTVMMWEVRAASADAAVALSDWLLSVAVPAVAGEPGYDRAEVFRGAENRVVMLVWWRGESVELPAPPPHLLARPAHFWDFTTVGVG